jgi:cellulose biosynthesis protein BcsQ
MKGGVGKSTLAVHAYEYARRQRQSAWLVDMDPQGSSSAWLDGNDPKANCYHLVDPKQALAATREYCRNILRKWSRLRELIHLKS